MRVALTFVAASMVAIATPSCSGKLTDEERFTDATKAFTCNQTPAETQANILQAKCAATCHSAAAHVQNLDLETPDAASRLFGLPSTCDGKLLLDNQTPFAGYIFDKVTNAHPACGERMPYGGAPLSAEEIQCLHILLAPPVVLEPVSP